MNRCAQLGAVTVLSSKAVPCGGEPNQPEPRVPYQDGGPSLQRLLHVEPVTGPGHMSHAAYASALPLANRITLGTPTKLRLSGSASTTQHKHSIKVQRQCLGPVCGMSPWL